MANEKLVEKEMYREGVYLRAVASNTVERFLFIVGRGEDLLCLRALRKYLSCYGDQLSTLDRQLITISRLLHKR